MPGLKVSGLQRLVHIGALLPLGWLAWQFSQGQLTANPIREIQLRTGEFTLTLLVLSLACTPIYNTFRFNPARQLRRTLGLYAFAYASLHLLAFIGLDYGFNVALILEDISNKLYVFAGLAAFLILLLLAITSTGGWVKSLGKNWRRLHRLVYVAGVLAVLHFIWLTKSKADLRLPLIYGAVIALLLIVRIPVIAKIISWPFRRTTRERGNHPVVDDI